MLNKPKGFTLLEVLVALFIFTILSFVLTLTLHTITSNQKKLAAHLDSLKQLQLALFVLEEDINETLDRPILINANKQISLIGAPHALTFTRGGLSNPFGLFNRSSLERVSYEVLDRQLFRFSYDALDRINEAKSSKILLNNIVSFEFAYLDFNGYFHNYWPDEQNIALPKAIKITIQLKNFGTISTIFLLNVDTLTNANKIH